MKSITEYRRYVQRHRLRAITVGRSGASVYELDNRQVAKHIRRDVLKNDALWSAYERESAFYTYISSQNPDFVPEVIYNHCDGREMLLILKKYRPIERSEISAALLDTILAALAKVHALKIPDFLPRQEPEPVYFSSDALSDSLSGWKSVLGEHGDIFRTDTLSEIVKYFNDINAAFTSRRRRFVHGDFHLENILSDENGGIILCDWQNCGIGDISGDLSFFISRLLADGYPVNAETVIPAYCRHARAAGEDIRESEVDTQIRLANLNTSFMFWHQYLHDSPAERVRNIYEKMTDDFDCLVHRMI